MAAVADGNIRSEVIVMTYVNPEQPPPSGTNQIAVSNVGNPSSSQMLAFLKVQPKPLGVVQIMNGVVIFLLWFLLLADRYMLFFLKIVFMASLFYIITGILSIRTEKRRLLHLVKYSLGVNVISSVIAGIALVCLSVDCLITSYTDRGWGLRFGIIIVMMILTLLQFIISICISGFGCKAICCTQPAVQLVATASLAPPSHSGEQVVMNGPPVEASPHSSMKPQQAC